ncbi:MAG: hypothetical protein XE08_0470, partial [Parcubacteria bacterium 32_520]
MIKQSAKKMVSILFIIVLLMAMNISATLAAPA